MAIYYPGADEKIRVCGRTVKKNPLPLFWTGSGIEFVTNGGTVSLSFDTDYSAYEQWIRIEVDGYSTIRMPLAKGESALQIFKDFAPGEAKTVRIYKEVQAMPGDEQAKLLLLSVETDGELLAPPQHKLRMEFVGDSITSGEGVAGAQKNNAWVSAAFSTYGHYAFLTAAALDAEVSVVSQSGWGTYCTWDNDPNGALPAYYEQVCGVVSGAQNEALGAKEAWDFSQYQPEVIVINLGTNDASAFEQPAFVDANGTAHKQEKNADGSYEQQSVLRYQKAVIDFLEKVRKNNPQADIYWVLGMLGDGIVPCLLEAIAQYKQAAQDEKVWFVKLPDTLPSENGSNSHPGPLSHMHAAQVLIDTFSKYMK